MQPSDPVSEIVIVGAGLAGLIQARALQKRGFDPLLVDPRPEDVVRRTNGDQRATALTPASVERLGLPAAWLAEHGQQIGQMVVDGGLLEPLEPGEALHLESGAWVVFNDDLRRFLLDDMQLKGAFGAAVEGSDGVAGARVLRLANGQAMLARLVIAADGKQSNLRRREGIQRHLRDFQQTALTGVIEHSAPHEGRALQRFLHGGTLAFLPLQDGDRGHRSSFIWVEPSRTAKALFALEPAILAERMQARLGPVLGTLSPPQDADWGAFPLTAHHCDTLIADRLALIGEAAHSLHPLAGQGLNLSIKDAEALTDALVAQRRAGLDVGDLEGLRDYERARRADTARLTSVTTALHDVFDRGPAPIRAIATAGLKAIDRVAPLKAFLERQANR